MFKGRVDAYAVIRISPQVSYEPTDRFSVFLAGIWYAASDAFAGLHMDILSVGCLDAGGISTVLPGQIE